MSSILQNIAAFGNFKWEILINPFELSPFFTSDFPVAIEQTSDLRYLNRIVPLAPNLAIRIKPDLAINRKLADFTFANFGCRVRRINHNEAIWINQLIVRCAEETVFYRDDLPWIGKFIAKNRNYRIQSNVQKIPEEKGFYLFSRQNVSRCNRQN